AFGIPEVEPTGGEMNPSGVNNWDGTTNTLYLVQATGAGQSSIGRITVASAGGSKIELPVDSEITVSPTSSEHTTQEYTFQWAATDAADLTEKGIAVNVLNNSNHEKIEVIKVKLLPNQISNLQLTPRTGFTLSDVTATSAKLTMPVSKGQFTITMDNYSEPVVSQHPSWLKVVAPVSTRSTPTGKTTSFTFELDEDAESFDDSTPLVFTNASGGTGMTVDITKEFQAPTITYVSSDPSVNSYSSGRLNLYQLKWSYSSTATIKVYSLGGSKLELPAGVTVNQTTGTGKEKDYVIAYKVSKFSLSDLDGGTIYAKNLSDETKSQSIAVTFKSSVPKVTSSLSGVSCSCGTEEVDVTITENLYTGGRTGFPLDFTSPAGYTFTSMNSETGADALTEVSAGSQTGSAGSIKNPFTLSFKSTATLDDNSNLYYYYFAAKDTRFPDYRIDLYVKVHVCLGTTAFKLNGLWVIPYRSGTKSEALSAASSAEDGWRVPSLSDFQTLLGLPFTPSYSGTATITANADYVNRIFKVGPGERYMTTDMNTTLKYRMIEIGSTTQASYTTVIANSSTVYPYILVRNQ
ncbi:MAG: hypothetical protein LUF01_11760, partial [Bacteroides sp.]|nr:hypothetical protein [Bacteroides sp.]